MISKKLFSERFEYMITCYNINWYGSLKESKMRSYYGELKDFSEEAFEGGVKKCIGKFKFFPSVSELLMQCKASMTTEDYEMENYEGDVPKNIDILNNFYNSKECDRRLIKKYAFDLMRQKEVIDDNYVLGSVP